VKTLVFSAFPQSTNPFVHIKISLPFQSYLVKSLKARGQIRRGVVTLPREVQKLYLDDEGNVRFNDEYLEEIEELKKPKPATNTNTIITTNITTDHSCTTQKSLQSITKDAVIPKFDEHTMNATTWLAGFEKECTRLEIDIADFRQALCLFLTGSSLDWYTTNFLLLDDVSWND